MGNALRCFFSFLFYSQSWFSIITGRKQLSDEETAALSFSSYCKIRKRGRNRESIFLVTKEEINYLYNEFGRINGNFSQISKRTIWKQNINYLFSEESEDNLERPKKYLKDKEDENMEKVDFKFFLENLRFYKVTPLKNFYYCQCSERSWRDGKISQFLW